MKSFAAHLIFFFVFLETIDIFSSAVYAQDAAIRDYLSETGNFTAIYNGKIKSEYNSLYYENTPYYKSNTFVEGIIELNNGNRYPGQKLRLDLYAEQLEILTPVSHYSIIFDEKKVAKAILGDETFVFLSPKKKSGIQSGYYHLLFDTESFKLYKKTKFKTFTKGVLIQFYFDTKYYICLGDAYSSVNNKGSFTKLFPQYKKQINSFCKEKRLKFNSENRGESLSMLADYCHQLITADNEK